MEVMLVWLILKETSIFTLFISNDIYHTYQSKTIFYLNLDALM